jgi:pimeloyl-ACP methyl ester carboxylesterase
MPAALIDGLEVYYETRGSGQPLLMLAPRGFDSTADKWLTASAWKEINALDKLSSEFQLIVYDRRESGKSSGRVEKLTWDLFARQAKGLLDHLKIDSAFALGAAWAAQLRYHSPFASRKRRALCCFTGRWEVAAGRQIIYRNSRPMGAS